MVVHRQFLSTTTRQTITVLNCAYHLSTPSKKLAQTATMSPSTTTTTMSEPPPSRKRRNAFSAIMSTSQTPAKKPKSQPRYKDPRDGLGPYISHPSNFPPTAVIHHTPDFVYIRDLYPKATVHCLLLPRDTTKTRLHPFEAFSDPEFLRATKEEAGKLRRLVGAELKRLFGEQNGRDWEKEVKVGVHSNPSMNHLHVHVISRDNHSERLKTGKHYNSFNTPFFVDLEDLPLPEEDERRSPGMGFIKSDLICWRCGTNYGNRYKQLSEHLEEEFEEWKKEPGQAVKKEVNAEEGSGSVVVSEDVKAEADDGDETE
ncbi:HIT-like protein [Wilcoxina mikolae CBS 423.85]|nr:HIT-like protein [Wilcoxina mikolae CBS 423.85]